MAALNHDAGYAEILLRNGDGKSLRDSRGRTALDHARINRDLVIVKLLQ